VRIRAHLRTPAGETVIRDSADGVWEEPAATSPDVEIGQDWYALPGLIDAHAHFAAPIGKDWKSDTFEQAVDRANQAVRAGVMLALDKGWSNLDTIRVIETVPAQDRPEIEAAGIINSVEGGYWPDFARELTEENFDDGIQRSIDEGSGWVKLVGDWPRRGIGPVANFDENQLRRAVEMATAAGSKVAIHTMAREAPAMAVAAGVQSIEHGLFLDEDSLAQLGSRAGMWVPTIIRMEAVVAQLGENSSGGRLLVEGLENVRRLMPLAAEAGVLLLAGTDVTVGAHDVALEALKMVEYGLSVDAALDAVSRSGFLATERSDDFEVGSPANAVFFPMNPRDEIAVLQHPSGVVRLGYLLR
jgi:imidazolonepropionase-like amidohydrolase